ncbi:DoxX family protein [Edaphobacter modestus]|uniref:DoxX-like protein n=1 Tax=Edaphobacter modestus TaxID=388466 RepID=A0A4Q7YX04_9BACT|nr:DoxX family protein [Edaphobacter modestus]RZU41663.1 DoxX-like protein [Edaphobacter modestus]
MNASTSTMTSNKTKASKGLVAGFWISTALLALQMGFTAYAQLRLPQVAGTFAHLGFPAYFRIELSWAKLAGVAALLVPMVPARGDFLYLLKEWAYAGFAITLVSALIAHLAVGDGVEAWSWSVGTGVLWGVSYFFWRRVQAGCS